MARLLGEFGLNQLTGHPVDHAHESSEIADGQWIGSDDVGVGSGGMIDWLFCNSPESSAIGVDCNQIVGWLIFRERHIIENNVYSHAIGSSIDDWQVKDVLGIVNPKNTLFKLHV